MDSRLRKLNMIKAIININKEETLNKLESFLLSNSDYNYKEDLKPISTEALEARIAEAEENFKAGNYYSTDEVLRKIEEWDFRLSDCL